MAGYHACPQRFYFRYYEKIFFFIYCEKLDFQKAVDILFFRVCYHSSQRLSTKIYEDMEFKNDKLESDSEKAINDTSC